MKKRKIETLSLDAIVRRLEHLPKTIECGIHSGIPDCCVKFYSTKWIFSTEDSEFRNQHRSLIRESIFAERSYIPCPACCASGKAVQIKPCPGVPCWHREEQAGEVN